MPSSANKALRKTVGGLQGEQLSRMPKGFPVDHPAEGLLRQKQWYLESTLDDRPAHHAARCSGAGQALCRHGSDGRVSEPAICAQREAGKKMPFMAF